MSRATIVYQLVGFIPYGPKDFGFALPIFSTSKDNSKVFIQYVDEISGHISEFRPISHNKPISDINSRIILGIGDEPIHIFVDKEGSLLAGDIRTIRSGLTKFIDENSLETSINLQIYGLVGTQIEQRSSRKNFRNTVYDSGDTLAAKVFIEGSVLKTELWKILLRAAPSVESAKRILLARSNITVIIGENNRIHIDVSHISPEDYSNISLHEIERLIQTEFDEIIRPETSSENANEDEGRKYEENISLEVRKVKSKGRQEERVTLLLKIILDDPETGTQILQEYGLDRGKFALDSIKIMLFLLVTNRPVGRYQTEITKMVVRQIYRVCFPMNRGALLYFFAKYFSQYEDIRPIIDEKFEQSNSAAVNYWSDDILRELAELDKGSSTAAKQVNQPYIPGIT